MRIQSKRYRQLAFLVRSFLQTWPNKKWQGSSSATTVACARQVLYDTSLALNIITEHCPDLTKKQLHTMNELVVDGDFDWGFEPVCCWFFAGSCFFLFLLSLSSHLSPCLSSLILSLFSFSSCFSFNILLFLCLSVAVVCVWTLCCVDGCVNVVWAWCLRCGVGGRDRGMCLECVWCEGCTVCRVCGVACWKTLSATTAATPQPPTPECLLLLSMATVEALTAARPGTSGPTAAALRRSLTPLAGHQNNNIGSWGSQPSTPKLHPVGFQKTTYSILR